MRVNTYATGWPLPKLLCAALCVAVLSISTAVGPAMAGPLVGVSGLADNPDPVRVGEELTYTASVSNDGTDTASNVAVRLGVPEGTRFVSSRLTTDSGGRNCPLPAEDRSVTCNVGDMEAGSEAVLALVVVPMRLGRLENLATVSSDSGTAPGIEHYATTEVLPPDRCTVVGTEGVDELVGTFGKDTFCAFGGDDTIRGRDGDDVVYGGTGKDLFYGGPGSDTSHGQDGDDTTYGGGGNDDLRGGYGKDGLFGGANADTLRARDGVSGNDTAQGGEGRDTIFADRGDLARN